MKIAFLKLMSVVFGIILVSDVFSQCKDRTSYFEIEAGCAKKYSEPSYLSDGQDYRALLKGNATAEFYPTFYNDNTYRIIGCTDIEGGSLLFTITDIKGNVLFNNKDHQNAPYWDLEFKATVECKITVGLSPETQKLAGGSEPVASGQDSLKTESAASGTPICSVILIGYKQ